MTNLKRPMTPKWLKEHKITYMYFYKQIMIDLQHLWALPRSLQCLELDSRRRDSRPRRDFGVRRSRQDRDFKKRASRHPPLVVTQQ